MKIYSLKWNSHIVELIAIGTEPHACIYVGIENHADLF